jgi:hypothetical protein
MLVHRRRSVNQVKQVFRSTRGSNGCNGRSATPVRRARQRRFRYVALARVCLQNFSGSSQARSLSYERQSPARERTVPYCLAFIHTPLSLSQWAVIPINRITAINERVYRMSSSRGDFFAFFFFDAQVVPSGSKLLRK